MIYAGYGVQEEFGKDKTKHIRYKSSEEWKQSFHYLQWLYKILLSLSLFISSFINFKFTLIFNSLVYLVM